MMPGEIVHSITVRINPTKTMLVVEAGRVVNSTALHIDMPTGKFIMKRHGGKWSVRAVVASVPVRIDEAIIEAIFILIHPIEAVCARYPIQIGQTVSVFIAEEVADTVVIRPSMSNQVGIARIKSFVVTDAIAVLIGEKVIDFIAIFTHEAEAKTVKTGIVCTPPCELSLYRGKGSVLHSYEMEYR